MKGQVTLEFALMLLAYLAFVAVLSFAFKDFSSLSANLEENALLNRYEARQCFFAGIFYINARNAAFEGKECVGIWVNENGAQ